MPAATPALKNVLSGISVIDCDTHYTEPADLWVSRAPAKFRDRVPHLQRIEPRHVEGEAATASSWDTSHHWFIEGDQDFGQMGATVVGDDGKKAIGAMSVEETEHFHTAAYDPKARVQLMDSLGIWAQIMYPNAAGFSSAKFMNVIKDPELRYECIRIYNDAIAEFQTATNGRCLGQGLLPIWDQELLMRETRRAVEELKLTGFTVADRPDSMGVPGYGTEYWAPFWEFCNATETPINFHIGAAVGIDGNAMPWGEFGFERKHVVLATAFYLSNSITLSNFLLSGLFDRYPKLKMVSVESGVGWVPFVLEALEYQLDEMMPVEGKLLKRRPKEYFRDHFYACFWFEDYGPRKMIEAIGAGNILFETDFPHPTCLYPKNQEHVADVLADLSPEVRRMILQDNAAKLYGIALPALAP